MGTSRKGMYLRLSPARKVTVEMLRQAQAVPLIPVARKLRLPELAAARRAVPAPPSWTALFLRAYGLVARQTPELRRAYIRLPYPRLYEHPHSVAALVVEREHEGETVLVTAKIRAPENLSLEEIGRQIRRFKEAPLHKVSQFRRLLRVGRLPGFLRRFTFWHTLHWSGGRRAKRAGTFMVSSYGSLGAEQLLPRCPLTSLLTFGPVSAAGDVVARIVYDHRVMDGRRVAAALALLEQLMVGDLVREVRQAPTQAA